MPELDPDRVPVKLYWAEPLTLQYIAEDDQGDLWMLPCSPLSPETWERRRTRYHGNWVLHPVVPEIIINQYRRQPGLRTPGRPASGVPRATLELSISQAHADALTNVASRTGQTRRELVERALQLAYPDEFPPARQPES